ncbi:hypothetical protein [Gorillibacterium timonense]|uniref:hypothetical protein n=1 Tax=Gorillibacterium timonense TaxID=1689269 RepID=UPI00071CA6EE|nr:hypothetical protein [Gorillibacterium timonense]
MATDRRQTVDDRQQMAEAGRWLAATDGGRRLGAVGSDRRCGNGQEEPMRSNGKRRPGAKRLSCEALFLRAAVCVERQVVTLAGF